MRVIVLVFETHARCIVPPSGPITRALLPNKRYKSLRFLFNAWMQKEFLSARNFIFVLSIPIKTILQEGYFLWMCFMTLSKLSKDHCFSSLLASMKRETNFDRLFCLRNFLTSTASFLLVKILGQESAKSVPNPPLTIFTIFCVACPL